MIQKERTRLPRLIDEVAEIFQTSSLFWEQLNKVTRGLQNLISCYKNIHCSKSQTNVQSCHQFLFKKKVIAIFSYCKTKHWEGSCWKISFYPLFLSLPSTVVPSWEPSWSCSHIVILHVILVIFELWCARSQLLFYSKTLKIFPNNFFFYYF